MTLVFAYLSSISNPPGWPIHLMHITEAVFCVLAAFCSFVMLNRPAIFSRRAIEAIAVVGSIALAFALVMPFELAPFFFGARGEIMLATFVLGPIGYVALSVLFIGLSLKLIKK